jgi:hypothetical protein
MTKPDAPNDKVGFRSAAAVLPVRSVKAALEHYRKLGFTAEAYGEQAENGDPVYGFLSRGDVALHLARTPDLVPAHSNSAVYIYVDDAAAICREWHGCGAGGRFGEVEETPYGLREFFHIDPDGNLLRLGSPIR